MYLEGKQLLMNLLDSEVPVIACVSGHCRPEHEIKERALEIAHRVLQKSLLTRRYTRVVLA